MKFQKYILCAAVALTAFGVSLGLFKIGRYFQSAFEPQKMPSIEVPPMPVPSMTPVTVEYEAPVFSEPEESEEKSFCAFDPMGEYYIIGGNPKGFEDFDTLSIVTRDYETDPEKEGGIPIKPEGMIVAIREFNFSRIKIDDKRISFTTQTKRGVSYRFEGKFIDEEVVKFKASDGEDYTDYAVLKGRLTKYRNGQKIAESKVKFGENCGC